MSSSITINVLWAEDALQPGYPSFVAAFPATLAESWPEKYQEELQEAKERFRKVSMHPGFFVTVESVAQPEIPYGELYADEVTAAGSA